MINKRTIFLGVLFLMFIILISLYKTYSFNELDLVLEESTADYNIKHVINTDDIKEISVSSKEEKKVDIILKNIYTSSVEYAIYYQVLNMDKLPNDVTITLDDDSKDLLNNKILPNNECIISIKIVNNSDDTIKLNIGSLIGFENGDINELVKDNINLIK